MAGRPIFGHTRAGVLVDVHGGPPKLFDWWNKYSSEGTRVSIDTRRLRFLHDSHGRSSFRFKKQKNHISPLTLGLVIRNEFPRKLFHSRSPKRLSRRSLSHKILYCETVPEEACSLRGYSMGYVTHRRIGSNKYCPDSRISTRCCGCMTNTRAKLMINK